MKVYGNPNHPIDFEYPKNEDLDNFPLNKKIKLRQICWKNYSVLKGLQLKFTNGVETPLFQTDKMAKIEPKGDAAIKSWDIGVSP